MGAGSVCLQRPGCNLVVRVGREEEGVSSLRPELAAIARTLQAIPLETDLLYLCDSEAALNRMSTWIGSGPRTTLAGDPNADIVIDEPVGEAPKEVEVTEDNSIKDFASVEVLPEFNGGMAGWGKYLQKNLKYPPMARENNITGRVIMSFVVEKNGQLTDIKVLRGIGGGCDEEASRVLKNAPAWKPGIQNGRPVRVAYTMPIFFQLAGQ